MKFKYILFDLDGTLIDTNQLIIDSFRHTYKQHLNLEVEEQEILQYFGEPLITTLERYAPENAKELFDTYISYNESMHDSSVSLCCNIEQCLKQLKELGCELAVVTSKRSAMAYRGLELFDILKYFSVVVTVDDTTRHKPQPEPVLKALEKLGAKAQDALMIGDSIFDIQCAHNAGVKAVQVNWGAATGHQGEEEPDYFVEDALEIIDIVKGAVEEEAFFESSLLMTAKDDLQANIIESLLKAYDIPVKKVYNSNDGFLRVYMSLTTYGVDMYVPKSALEEAQGIIRNELLEEASKDDESLEEQAIMLELDKVHNITRRKRAAFLTIFFIPGIIGLLIALIYWIVKMI